MRHPARDYTWIISAVPGVIVSVLLGCILALYVQTWWPLIIAVNLSLVLLAGSAIVHAVLDRSGYGRPRWACPHCGYDRRGLAADAVCPECGRGREP